MPDKIDPSPPRGEPLISEAALVMLIRRHRRQALLNALVFTTGLTILFCGLFLALDLVSLRKLAAATNHATVARLILSLRFRLPPESADPYEALAGALGVVLMLGASIREWRGWQHQVSSR